MTIISVNVMQKNKHSIIQNQQNLLGYYQYERTYTVFDDCYSFCTFVFHFSFTLNLSYTSLSNLHPIPYTPLVNHKLVYIYLITISTSSTSHRHPYSQLVPSLISLQCTCSHCMCSTMKNLVSFGLDKRTQVAQSPENSPTKLQFCKNSIVDCQLFCTPFVVASLFNVTQYVGQFQCTSFYPYMHMQFILYRV